MPNTITTYTETSCWKCGATVRREGSRFTRPSGWMCIRVQVVDEKGEDKQRLDVDALCVPCGDAVLAVLGMPRKRSRKPKILRTIGEVVIPPVNAINLETVTMGVNVQSGNTITVANAAKTHSHHGSRKPISISLPVQAGDGVEEEAQECPWATGPHRHSVKGDEVTCLAAEGQWKLPALGVA